MIRVVCVLTVFAALAAVPLGCSKFNEAGAEDTPPDAGGPEVAAPSDGGPATLEHRVYVFGGVTSVPGPVPITSAYVAVAAANGDLGPWTKLPALEDNRYAAAGAQLGDTQFAIGGTAQTAAYSPATEHAALPQAGGDSTLAWKTTAPMATGRNYAAAVVRGTSIYVSGGRNAAGTVQNVERYDTTGGTWTGAGPLMPSVAGHSVLIRNALMYVVGGDRLTAGGPTTAVLKAPFAADGSLGTFQSAGDLKSPLAYHSVAVVEPWLYTIGGATATSTVASVLRGTFDTSDSVSSSWETIAPLPLPSGQAGLAEACTVVVGRTIYVFGGRDVATASSKGDVYIGRVDEHGVITWSTGPALPEGRSALGCAVSPSSAP